MRSVSRLCFLVWVQLAAVAALPPRAHAGDMQEQWRLLQDAQAAYQRGLGALQRGDRPAAEQAFEAASSGFQAVLQLNPLRTDLYAPLGDILIRRGQSAAAYALLVKQTQAGVTDVAVRVQLLKALVAMGRPQRAMEEAQTFLRAAPNTPELWAAVGELHAQLGNVDQAIADLKRAAARVPEGEWTLAVDGLSIRRQLARLLIERARAAEALDLVTPLARTHPGDSELQLLLGTALVRSGRAAEAVSSLQRYVKTAPGNKRALALLGQALADSGQVPAAVALLEKAGDDPELLYNLGQLQQRKQPPDLAAAQTALEKATGARPESLVYCAELARILAKAQKDAQALTEISRCTTPLLVSPDTQPGEGAGLTELQQALLLRGDIELRLGRVDEAVTTLRGAIGRIGASSPLVAPLRGKLATSLLRRGISRLPASPLAGNPAYTDLEEAHKLAPSPQTGHALALGLLSAGKADEALQMLQPLATNAPNDPRLLGALGRALRETGQAGQALVVLQKAEALVAQASAVPGSPETLLRTTLKQEQAQTLIALQKPMHSIKALDGSDEAAQQLKAQASLVAARQLFTDAAKPGQRLNFHALMFVTQQALKAGAGVQPAQRAEAKLWQVLALFENGQEEVAAKLIAEVAKLFDAYTLQSLMGQGGFENLQARVMLRGGDFNQAVALAQQALPQLKPEEARSLQTAVAATYTGKAVDVLARTGDKAEKAEIERAHVLLRYAIQYAQGGPPVNVLRATYNLAMLALLRGRPDEAKALLAKLDAQALPEAHLGMGCYFDALGDSRSALDSYRRYLQAVATQSPPPPPVEKVQKWVDVLSRVHEGMGRAQPSAGRALPGGHRRPGGPR
jgi:tetratricopeptide (TPR) repeat protein